MNEARLIFSLRNSEHYVRGSDFSNEDLKSVPASSVALSLEGADVDDEGILGLSRLRSLRVIDLDNTKVTDRCLVEVARLPALEELWLECTSVTDAGLKELHSLRNLKFVSLAYTAATQQGVEALRRAIPGVEVSS